MGVIELDEHLTVIGAGLAGCEAAWQAAQRGLDVTLFEMKPVRFSPAHVIEGFAELVCSNSLRSNIVVNAVGLLKGIWSGGGWLEQWRHIAALSVFFGIFTAISSRVFRWE